MIFEKDRLAVGRERYSLQNAKHWISTETGSHLLLDGEGNVVGGAAGKLKGQKFVKVTRKSKDVEGGAKEEKKTEESKAATKDKAKEGKPIKSLLTDTSLLATSPSAEMAKKAIAKFYVDKPENIELVPVNDSLFRVQKKASGKILEGVQVSVAKGRYRFEMGKVAKENSSPIKVYRASR